MKSIEFSKKHEALKNKLTQEIEKILERRGGEFEMETWEDEANNEIIGISLEKGVAFEDMAGAVEYYPISELGFDDAIYVLGLLEA